MNQATMDPPNDLENEVDTPDLDENEGEGEGSFLITYNDGALEIVETQGTDDESVSADDLVERFDAAVKRGAAFLKLGRRRIRLDLVRSFGPDDEVDYPEVSVFAGIEDRTERMLRAAEDVQNNLYQSAQAVGFLTQQQAALQQAQAQLFEEESEGAEEAASAPAAPRASAGTAALRPLKVPGVPKK